MSYSAKKLGRERPRANSHVVRRLRRDRTRQSLIAGVLAALGFVALLAYSVIGAGSASAQTARQVAAKVPAGGQYTSSQPYTSSPPPSSPTAPPSTSTPTAPRPTRRPRPHRPRPTRRPRRHRRRSRSPAARSRSPAVPRPSRVPRARRRSSRDPGRPETAVRPVDPHCARSCWVWRSLCSAPRW